MKKPDRPTKIQPGRGAVTDALNARAQGIFLEELAKGWSVTHSAEKAGFSRQTAYKYRELDEQFRTDWDDAIERGTDRLEDAMEKRAVDGVMKPVYQGKELVGHVQEYSDSLAMFMAKARRPDKFRERSTVSHTGPNGGPLVVVAGSMTAQEAAEAYAATLNDDPE